MPSVDAFNSTGQTGLKVLNSVLTNDALKGLKWKKADTVCYLTALTATSCTNRVFKKVTTHSLKNYMYMYIIYVQLATKWCDGV